jgi:hypothetical protein
MSAYILGQDADLDLDDRGVQRHLTLFVERCVLCVNVGCAVNAPDTNFLLALAGLCDVVG